MGIDRRRQHRLKHVLRGLDQGIADPHAQSRVGVTGGRVYGTITPCAMPGTIAGPSRAPDDAGAKTLDVPID